MTPAAAGSAASLPSEPSSTGIIALTVALGVAGLVLFGAGFIAFVPRPVAVPQARPPRSVAADLRRSQQRRPTCPVGGPCRAPRDRSPLTA